MLAVTSIVSSEERTMEFFGMGMGEVLLILVVAMIVFGPGKIVQVSRELGKMVHAFRKTSSELAAQVTKELESEDKDHPKSEQDNQKVPASK